MGTTVDIVGATPSRDSGLTEAAAEFRAAAEAKKCWACGCLRHALAAVDRALPAVSRPEALNAAVAAARERLVPQRYECLGCAVCYPAVALDALGGGAGGCAVEAAICPTEKVEERAGWPPLPGAYRVLRYHAPVAGCTLNDQRLADAIAEAEVPALAIAGTLQTENLGIERLVANVLANPSIRFVVVCGPDSRQAIGHLPGQSLVSLAREGVDGDRRIVGAKGRRPVLRNLEAAAIEHFRRTVEVVDLVGVSDVEQIASAIRNCAERHPGPATAFAPHRVIAPIAGYVPEKMVSDPAGYFVIFIDRVRKLLCVEHYHNNGLLMTIIEGRSAAKVYMPAIDRGLLSRLDHAAYLGRELARAEHALLSGDRYVQDAAPEAATAAERACEGACGADTAGSGGHDEKRAAGQPLSA